MRTMNSAFHLYEHEMGETVFTIASLKQVTAALTISFFFFFFFSPFLRRLIPVFTIPRACDGLCLCSPVLRGDHRINVYVTGARHSPPHTHPPHNPACQSPPAEAIDVETDEDTVDPTRREKIHHTPFCKPHCSCRFSLSPKKTTPRQPL